MQNTEGRKRKYGMGKTAKVLLTLLIVFVLLFGGVLIASGIYAKGLDTVYPNVSINGTNLSRMSREQAKQALISAGYEDNVNGVSVTVNFPNGEQMVITGDDAGLSLDASNAAAAAFDYGRKGSFITNGITLIKSLVLKTELNDENLAQLNEDYVRSVVNEYTSNFNNLLLEDSSVIEEDRIVVIKDAGGSLASADDVYELTVETLHKALEQNTGLTVDYTLKNTGGNDVDLTALYNKVNAEPIPARYDNETKSVTESVTGVSFDMDAARAELDAAKSGEQVIIPLIFTQPEPTTEQLEGLLFRDALASTKTYIDGTSNRLNNVVTSAAAINGLVLNPGETFSFNDTVGKRTAERGYKEAGAYVGGKTVQEIGGGICQTSSTLYDAVLYANLEVIARSYHMFTVPYLPAGHDATISWGSIDFKFKNNTDYPIRIDSVTEGRYITVTLYGTKLDENYVKYENVTISSTSYKTVQKEDASVAPGKTVVDTDGHSGLVVDTYKLSYDKDGNLLSRTLIHRSSYRVQDRVILVPVGTLEPTTTPTDSPSASPSSTPTSTPSATPSETPSESPSETPSETPSDSPSETPADASDEWPWT